MTFELVAHTVLAEGVPDRHDDGSFGGLSVPFGRTGCELLPDGSFIVSVYYDTDPTDTIHVWKVGPTGTVLGELVIETGGDNDGRMHVTALDGFLVQVLYMTGFFPGGLSFVLDCSGDDPVVVDQWDDPLPTSGYGSDTANVYSLYNRAHGVVLVQHREGISMYRRGRPIINRTNDFGGGGSGLFPHPTNPDKCAFWSYSAEADWDFEAAEITIISDSMIEVETLGLGVPSDTIAWCVGQGSPYDTVPLALNENNDGWLEVIRATDPTEVFWTDPTPGAGDPDYLLGINSDALATHAGTKKFAFMHELWHDIGPDYTTPTRKQFSIRAGMVDNTSGTPVVEQLDLDYGVTSPDGYWNDWNYVSLLTGSHSIAHRNGEIVMATCIVEQEHLSIPEPNYYSVVAWKLTGGELTPLSGLDGSWRQGIDNRSGRNVLKSTDGWLPEAGESVGLDAPAQPVWVKGSDGWMMLGRFVEPGACLTPTGEAIMQYMNYAAGDTSSYWVGTAPRLTTNDDTSYARIGVDDNHYPAILLPATPCPVGSVVKVTARVRLLGEWTGYGDAGWSAETMLFSPGSSGFASNIIRTPVVADGEWQTYVSFIPWTDEIEEWVAEIEAGSCAVGIFGNTTSTEIYDVSYIQACVLPGLPEPEPPTAVEVTYRASDINTDLAAAQALAGATYTVFSTTYGPFVAQTTPPVASALSDGSDSTFTTLVQSAAGDPVEVFTARLTPTTTPPVGGIPVAAAFTVRSRATAGDAGAYLDGLITPGTTQAAIRSKSSYYTAQLGWNTGPTLVTSSYGLTGKQATIPDHPGRFDNNGYYVERTLADALVSSSEPTAAYWADLVADPDFYITVQSVAANPANGDLELADLSLTIKYLIP